MVFRRSAFRLLAALSTALAASAGFAQSTVTLNATSGTGTISTTYTTNGGLTLDLGFFAEYLVVGGGGGGGGSGDNGSAWGGGGGGAGGLLTGTTTLSATSYAVTVGGGGAGGQFSATAANQQGSNGANSVFGAIATGTGGGGGGSFKVAGNNGGSGGGGGGRGTGNDLRTPGGTGTVGQGNNGGASRDDDSSGRSAGGGGGGAGAVGGTGGTNVTTAGNGGAGLASSITGANVTYAGGGGGGAWDTFDGETAGTGGLGGGGAGSTSGNGTVGTDGLGGGGGGVGTNGAGGRGGAGQVVVRYQGASLGAIGGTVTSGTGSAAGYTLHTFTTSGTTTATSALDLSGVNMNARLATTLTGVISGSGGLTFAGPGRLTLAASNSFTGDTRISSGTLAIGNANALLNSVLDMNASDSGAVAFSQNSTIGGLKGSRAVDNGGNTLTIGATGASTTYSGELSGTGGLTKQGAGTLTLSGSNSFTGDTQVYAGALAIANANALAGSTLNVFGGITFSQASNIGGLKGNAGNTLANGGYTLTVGGNNQSTTYAGTISGSGSLIKNGTGTLTLSGYGGFTGDTRIVSGTLAIAGNSALIQTTLDMNADDSGAVIFASGAYIGGLKGSRNLANGGNYLIIGGNNQSTTYSGELSGSGFFWKQGTGTLTLSGSNSFTGDTRVSQGRLVVANANALAGSTLDTQYGTSLTFLQASNLGGIKSYFMLNNGGYTLTIGGNDQSTTYTGNYNGSGGLTKAGTGTLTLGSFNTFTGDTRIASGTLAIGHANALMLSTLDMNASDSGGITFSQDSNIAGLKGARNLANGGKKLTISSNASTTYSGILSGAGGLTKNGSSTLTLSGNNTYAGLTTVLSGSLAVGDGGTSGSLASAVNLRQGASLVFNRSDASTYAGNIIGAGSLTKLGTGALTLTGANTFTGDTTVSAGTLILGSGNALSTTAAVTVASGATLQATTAIRIGYLDSQGTVVGGENLSATLTVTNAGSIGGIANGTDTQGTFAAGIVKLSSGTSTVNAANTYTGLTWVRQGTLATGLANAFAAASDLTVDSGATLDRASYSQTVADAVLNGTVGNTGGGGLLTVTGTLSGSGLVNGDVTVTGVHAPGNSPGIQTFDGDLTYGNGASIAWELTDNTTSNSPVVFDQIVLSNASNLTFSGSNVLALSFDGAGSLVDWTDSFWDVNRAWTVFDLASGATTGFSNLSLGGSLLDANGLALDAGTRGYFSLAASGQDVTLVFTAVPEPSTLVLGAVGIAGAAWMRRRRLRVKTP